VPAFIFLLLLFAARGLGPFFQVLNLPVERAHAVDRAVDAVDEALALVVGYAKFPHSDRRADNRML